MLNDLKRDHNLVVTIEDGSLDGGFGERIAHFYGPSTIRVMNFGVKKALYDRYDVNELMRENHLTDEQIIADIKRELGAKIIIKIYLSENKEVTLFVQLNW